VPYLHHDDNQSCNLRAARIEQDGLWQKTWKIALSCRPRPLDIQYGPDIGLRNRDRDLGGGLNVSGFRMLKAMVWFCCSHERIPTIVGSPLPDSHTQQI
jgi:hypothetical protein